MATAPSQATFTIKSGPGAGGVIDLPQGELLIGRIEPAGLVIGDSEVSRRHARLIYREGNTSWKTWEAPMERFSTGSGSAGNAHWPMGTRS